MSLALRDRPFTDQEFERLRLLLSTFRDGSGQYLPKIGAYMPDYRDFERCVGYVIGGRTTESKEVFDVVVSADEYGRLPYGVSCKMTAANSRSWFIEMSNSAKKFHDALKRGGVVWQDDATEAGPLLIEEVESWHEAVAARVELPGSRYLLLTHDAAWRKFELAMFDLDLQRAHLRREVSWRVEGQKAPSTVAGYVTLPSGDQHRLWQFYANSGGQLKYYPLFGWESWRSGEFELELPSAHDLADKVRQYWPGRWPEDDLTFDP